MSYRVIRAIIAFLWYGCPPILAQEVTVTGLAAPWYQGKTIEVQTYADQVTLRTNSEAVDSVRADGTFTLTFPVKTTGPIQLKIENLRARLYVEPGSKYVITLPSPDEDRIVNRDVQLDINPGVVGRDSTKLNALIFDFETQYNKIFLTDDSRFLGRAAMFRRADSLQKICDLRYKKVHNAYFHSYVDYFIAGINAAVSRGEDYLVSKYITGKPVLHDHYEYMRFFEGCFKGYLQAASARHRGQSLFNLVNQRGDLEGLYRFLRQEPAMRSDTVMELTCLVNFWTLYFDPTFDKEAIESLTSKLMLSTRIKAHQRIAANMMAYFGKLQPGSPAPDFSARARDGKVASIGSFKGRWIYLNFFSVRNSSSLKEMPKIADLKKRYGHKVTFVSVCLDDSLSDYRRYLRENPKFDWPIWFNELPGGGKTAKQQYEIVGTEGYYLISNLGDLVKSPAPSPSDGIEYSFNVIFKIKPKSQTGFR